MEQLFESLRLDGGGVVEALLIGTAISGELLELIFGLNPFGNDLEPELSGNGDQPFDENAAALVVLKLPYEEAFELENIDRQIKNVGDS